MEEETIIRETENELNKNNLIKLGSCLDKGFSLLREKKINIFKWAMRFLFLFLLIILSFSAISVGVNYESYVQAEEGTFRSLSNIAFGIIEAFFTILLLIFKPMIEFVLNFSQEAIYQCLSFQFIWGSLGIDYKQYLFYSGIIFVILLIVFLAISTYQNSVGKTENRSYALNFLQALIMFFFAPLFMGIVFLGTGLIMNWILGDRYGVSVAKLIESITIDNINTSGSNLVDVSLILTFIFSGILAAMFLGKFAIGLILRFFELIIFGLVAIPYVASASISDGGEKFSTWQGIMIQKILIPPLLIVGYVVALLLLPSVVNGIMNSSFNTHYMNSEIFASSFALVCIVAPFILLESLSPEWSFIVTSKGKSSFATQLGRISGVGSALWRYSGGQLTRGGSIRRMGSNLNNKRKDRINNPFKKENREIQKHNTSKIKDYNKSVLGKTGKEKEKAEKNFVKRWSNKPTPETTTKRIEVMEGRIKKDNEIRSKERRVEKQNKEKRENGKEN